MTHPTQTAIARILKNRYLDFSHYNKKNPLDELIFILLSVTTTEPVYLQTYRNFKKKFPRHSDILKASIREISVPIHIGGQFIQKAKAIKSIVLLLNERFGRPTLAPISKMTDTQCEELLTSLPRVGKKVARCVMLYSMGKQVFPVDTHCRRVALRLGWMKDSDFDVDTLQSLIIPKLRLSLHVNFISLGREFCKATQPRCSSCPITSHCPKNGVCFSHLA